MIIKSYLFKGQVFYIFSIGHVCIFPNQCWEHIIQACKPYGLSTQTTLRSGKLRTQLY